MSENSMRIGVGFSEYIGARENASITISNNVVNGRALFVLDVAGSSHVMVSNQLHGSLDGKEEIMMSLQAH